MRKLLGLVLVLALVAPAKADILKNLKTTGEIQVLGTMANDVYDSRMQYSQTSVRVLYGIGFDLTEDVKANMTLAYYNMWGNDKDVNGATTHTGSNIDSYLNKVNLVEANVVLKNLFCCLEAKVGRQFYGDENSAIIYFGPNHYNSEQRDALQAKSLDAVKLSYSGEVVAWDAIYAKVADTDDATTGYDNDDDASLLGLDAKVNVNDNINVQGYFYQVRNADAMGDIGFYDPSGTLAPMALGKYVGIYGIKPSIKLGDLNLSVEYARNVGGETAFDYDHGDLWKVDASLDLGAITPRAQMARGSHFQSFGNYRPGLIVGQAYWSDFGYNDGADDHAGMWDDILVYNLGVDMNFPSMDKFTYTLDGYMFYERNMKGSPTYEADLWVKYAMNNNVELHVAGGFMHDHGVDNAYKAQTGMLIRF
ncbi:hypothetical protein Dip510_002077 [Elusimicrobium posterum]|uniref:hypothetical protein n=1 Tax=Elusimicrobium posterum TaxID=3116653 RepID=UPI003C706A26